MMPLRKAVIPKNVAPESNAVKPIRRAPQVTSTPDTPPRDLSCPICDVPLVYRHTIIGGVQPVERWDYFDCRRCGEFVYRQRTRKLRRTE
jgi:hypothetical protein